MIEKWKFGMQLGVQLWNEMTNCFISINLFSFQVLKEIQSKKELEMVQRIIAQVKAECEATGGDTQRRGYTKH